MTRYISETKRDIDLCVDCDIPKVRKNLEAGNTFKIPRECCEIGGIMKITVEGVLWFKSDDDVTNFKLTNEARRSMLLQLQNAPSARQRKSVIK